MGFGTRPAGKSLRVSPRDAGIFCINLAKDLEGLGPTLKPRLCLVLRWPTKAHHTEWSVHLVPYHAHSPTNSKTPGAAAKELFNLGAAVSLFKKDFREAS